MGGGERIEKERDAPVFGVRKRCPKCGEKVGEKMREGGGNEGGGEVKQGKKTFKPRFARPIAV